MSIRLLPEDIINQIAAGEVIENPSAAIKELIENSIDAGAKNIEIEIEESGLKKIVVKDDGCGISKEDLALAPIRHATSKIQSFDDLYSIKTMGFRGEALASIFSVSKAKIISMKENSNAYEISYDSISNIREGASQKGTTVLIEDLFYNTPARKKYLRSKNMELKSIVDVVTRVSLFYFNIKFSLKNNGKNLLNKPIFKTLEENIYYVLGKELRDNLIYFQDISNGIKLSGFLGKPSNITYSVKKNQYIYVNSRFVKSKLISDAIYEGFGTNLMEGRHPFFVINVEIDPEIIDVNVHPTKIEIKFENELEIYEFVKNSVKKVFQINETFKPFETKKIEVELPLNRKIPEVNVSPEVLKVNSEIKSYFSKETQKPLDMLENSKTYKYQDEMLDEKLNESFSVIDSGNINDNEYGPLYDILKDYRIVGQINKTFVILETEREMIIVDQHVAEEKFFFETFKDRVENSSSKIQALLKPQIISLSISEMILYRENLDLIEKLGFQTEEFGSNEIVVRGVPIGLQGETVSPFVLKDILHEITADKKFSMLENQRLEKLASMSCKRSIKAGHEMTIPEIHNMIENLKKLKEPFNCPHGRPILLNWSFKDLEKKFKRIV